jgi:hypothetical protein
MSNVNTYDARSASVVVDGRFITGFAEGSMVEWEKDEDNFSTMVDPQGNVGVAITNNSLGTITVTLAQTSPQLTYMKSLANSRKIFPIWVQAGEEKVGGTQAMVKKTPDGELSDEISDREFEVQVFDFTDR